MRPDGVTVVCGHNTALVLDRVQSEGEEIVDAFEVLRSIRTRLPDCAHAWKAGVGVESMAQETQAPVPNP